MTYFNILKKCRLTFDNKKKTVTKVRLAIVVDLGFKICYTHLY